MLCPPKITNIFEIACTKERNVIINRATVYLLRPTALVGGTMLRRFAFLPLKRFCLFLFFSLRLRLSALSLFEFYHT